MGNLTMRNILCKIAKGVLIYLTIMADFVITLGLEYIVKVLLHSGHYVLGILLCPTPVISLLVFTGLFFYLIVNF